MRSSLVPSLRAMLATVPQGNYLESGALEGLQLVLVGLGQVDNALGILLLTRANVHQHHLLVLSHPVRVPPSEPRILITANSYLYAR